MRCVIVVPRGNSAGKNASMRAFGAELIEHGRDFDEAREHAARLAEAQQLHFVGPFMPELVAGVGTYALELFRHAPEQDTVYVPIGCGSGICGLIAARDALGLATQIVGVVSASAQRLCAVVRGAARHRDRDRHHHCRWHGRPGARAARARHHPCAALRGWSR